MTSLDTSKAIRIGGRISLCATQTSIYVALSSAPGTGSLRDPFLNAIIFMVAVILLILLFPYVAAHAAVCSFYVVVSLCEY